MTYINDGNKPKRLIPANHRKKRERRETRERQIKSTLRDEKVSQDIAVKGISDQSGDKWLLVSRGEISAIVRRDAYFGHGRSLWGELAEQGIALTRSASRSIIVAAIEDTKRYPQKVYVATRPGYHCGAFVKPDGSVIGEPKAKHFRVVLERKIPLREAGTLGSWKRVARKFAQGQVVYTTLLGAALVGPVLELFPEADNVCLWLEGETSTGKSTGLDFYCSVWGAPHQQPGSIGMSLRSTRAGLEQQMMARAGTAFAADEVNHLGQNERDQGERVYDLAFMVSHGVETERYNDSAALRVQQSFLTTSNTSLPRFLDGLDDSKVGPVLVRFLTIPADAGASHGAFDTIPVGYLDSNEAIAALKEALAVHHGTAANAFLGKLVLARRTDENALKAKLASYRDKFLGRAQVDPSDHAGLRRARSYAFIYAAARLAADWKILPLTRLKSLLLESYRRSGAAHVDAAPQPSLTAQQRVQTYILAKGTKIRDLDKRGYRSLTSRRLDARSGFLKTIKGRSYLLIRSSRWAKEFGPEGHRVLKELESAGLLIATEGLQTQTRVRSDRNKDRVYAIQVS